jgi:hypothetical protein
METATKTATAVKEPTIVSQKYVLTINQREGNYQPLPKKERKDTGKIGSQFVSKNGMATQTIIRGLSTDQERYFASKLINKNTRDQGYDEVMTAFWADFVVFVDGKLTLDASYVEKEVLLDGEKVVIEVPLVLEDYIKAKFCIQSSRVAFYEHEKVNKDLFDFIMEDLSIAEKTKHDAFKFKMEATSALTELFKESSEQSHAKIDWVLEVLREPSELFYGLKYVDKCIKLTEKQEQSPVNFVKALKDKNLEQRALLYKLTQTGIISKEGEALLFGDTLIGSTETEAIIYLADATKSAFVTKMQAQLKQLLGK